jgi:hypothetical protein
VVLEFNTVNYDTRDDFVERFHAQVVDESVSEEADQTVVRTVVQFPSEAAIRGFQREIAAYRGEQVAQPVLPPKGREPGAIAASPKSSTFTVPAGVTMMSDGFRSR